MVTALAREYEPDKRVEDVEEPPFLPAAFEHELAFDPAPPFRPERLDLDAESIAIGRVKTEDLIVHICLPETGEWHRLHPSTVKTACGLPVNYVRSTTRDGRHAEHPLAPCDCWTRVEREEAEGVAQRGSRSLVDTFRRLLPLRIASASASTHSPGSAEGPRNERHHSQRRCHRHRDPALRRRDGVPVLPLATKGCLTMRHHLRRLCDPLFLAISLPIVLPILFLTLVLTAARAFADTGGAPPLDPSLLELAFRGIAEGDWFLVAGPALAVVVYFARPVLGWLKPDLATSDRWGVVITAVLAGLGALAHAWIADEPVADATTLLGALKVFVTAVASYVVTKRLVAPKPAPASSSTASGTIGLVSIVVAVLAFGCDHGRRGLQHAGSAAATVIDCLTPEASDAIESFGPALSAVVRAATSPDGHVDWTPVKDAARGLKTPAKQCVLAAVVQEALSIVAGKAGAPQSAAAELDRESLRAGWEEQRGAWGGAKYKLPDGTL